MPPLGMATGLGMGAGRAATSDGAPGGEAAGITREEDLVLYYTFDESTGTSAADSSDTGNTGDVKNGAAWVTGKHNNCLDFDGVDDYVAVSANAAYPAGDFSYGCWISLESGAAYRTITMSRKYHHEDYDGNWVFRLNDTNTASPSLYFRAADEEATICEIDESLASLDFDTWHHAMFVHNDSANTIQLFWDGAALGSAAAISGDLEDASASGLYIATQFYGVLVNRWNGKIDDVRMYDAALIAGDVASIYGKNGPGLGDWP